MVLPFTIIFLKLETFTHTRVYSKWNKVVNGIALTIQFLGNMYPSYVCYCNVFYKGIVSPVCPTKEKLNGPN